MNNLLSNALVCILVAAILGGLAGWFLRKIKAQKQIWAYKEKAEAKLQGRDRYIKQLKIELQEAEKGIDLQHAALQKSLEERGFEVREQSQRTEDYQVRMQAAENKLISLQRNYIVFKTQKQREVEQLQNSLQKVLPLREEMQSRIQEFDNDGGELDMDSTLELDSEMRGEDSPFILRNALINEKRKVEHLSLVKKELSETYFRFAEEKQGWAREKVILKTRISELESSAIKVSEKGTNVTTS